MSGGDEVKKVVQKLTGIWWPEADEAKSREAADAYRLADEIDDICAAAHSAAQSVISNNSGEAIEKFEELWHRYNSGGKGFLPDSARACRQMADALSRFADEVEKVKRKIEEEIAIAGGVLVAGATLAVLTAGVSEAAAAAASAAIVAAAEAAGVALSVAVADIIGMVLAGVAFGAVEAITLDLAVAQPIKNAFGDQKAIDWNEALDWAESGAIGGGIAGGVFGAARNAGRVSGGLAGLSPKLAASGVGDVPAPAAVESDATGIVRVLRMEASDAGGATGTEGGKIGAGFSGARLPTMVKDLSEQVAKRTGGTISPNKGGYTIKIPHGRRNIIVRVMEKGAAGPTTTEYPSKEKRL